MLCGAIHPKPRQGPAPDRERLVLRFEKPKASGWSFGLESRKRFLIRP